MDDEGEAGDAQEGEEAADDADEARCSWLPATGEADAAEGDISGNELDTPEVATASPADRDDMLRNRMPLPALTRLCWLAARTRGGSSRVAEIELVAERSMSS